MNIKPLAACLFCVTAFAGSAYTQSKDTEKVDEKSADVAITANVSAKELVFEIVPNVRVEFFGTDGRKTEWSSERKNLPDSVQPNVVYRDIGIKLKIVSLFADIEKILDEALGTVPVGSDEPPKNGTQTTPKPDKEER